MYACSSCCRVAPFAALHSDTGHPVWIAILFSSRLRCSWFALCWVSSRFASLQLGRREETRIELVPDRDACAEKMLCVCPLSLHDKRLSLHGQRLSLHGNLLSIHGQRLSLHGNLLSIHGQRLSLHGNLLSIHGQRLSLHGVATLSIYHYMTSVYRYMVSVYRYMAIFYRYMVSVYRYMVIFYRYMIFTSSAHTWWLKRDF